MFISSRRQFLAASAASVGAVAAGSLFAQNKPEKRDVKGDGPLFVPTTLFLTWQRDPTTTMTVQWIGTMGETRDTTVAYTADTNGEWQSQPAIPRPYPMTDFKVFRAELTGLTPGTDYYFRIGKASGNYRFRTMPAKATNTIHFISGGDCGTNGHTIANNIQAARQDPMFTVVGGDLGYDNGKSVETSLAFIRNYSEHMMDRDGRLIPMIPCIGNHEVDGGFDKPRENAPFFYALFDGLYPETSYATLDFGDYLSLVLLDSGHNAEIGGEQASWLEKTLQARVDHPNVIPICHVPSYPSHRRMEPIPATADKPARAGTGVDSREHWCPLFDKYRVPVVFEHHDHTFKRTKPLLDGMVEKNGVLYLGDGSWGQLRSPIPPEEMPYMAVASGDYHLSLHRIQGEERFHLALDETGRVMDVTRSGQRTRL